MPNQNIAIIGAGPVGSYAASLLAKYQDTEVLLFEEHASIGTPVHCTGIVTPEIFNFIPKKSRFVINKIHDVRIFAPNGSFLPLSFKQPDIILDRVAFDQHFFNLACKAGAHPHMKHRFMSVTGDSALIKDLSSGKNKSVKFNHLVGADGPNSAVGRSAGILNNRKFFTGVQAVVKKTNDNILDFYPLRDGFGWSVPVDSNTLRIGVASQKNPKNAFDQLMNNYRGRIIDRHGGLIPIYNPRAKFCIGRKSAGSISLVGDAAGFVKATTGGGLVPGLNSAELLANSLLGGSFDGRSYRSDVHHAIQQDLAIHSLMRRLMNSFSQADWNDLIREMNSDSLKNALEDINRDKILILASSLLLRKPSLIRYGFKALRF
jgi:digeranylgeranylglycerophospholipid reductase